MSAGLLVPLVTVLVLVLLDPSATGARMRGLLDDDTRPTGPTYAFKHLAPDGDPAHWPTCYPIPYLVNPQYAPPDWEDMVHDAVDAIAEASGYDFEDVGTTRSRKFWHRVRDADAPPPVLVAWASAFEEPGLAGSTTGYSRGVTIPVGDAIEYLSAVVVLDADEYAELSSAGRTGAERWILVHELAHVLGLTHVDDPDQLMYPQYVGQEAFGAGDLEGLRRLHAVPCT